MRWSKVRSPLYQRKTSEMKKWRLKGWPSRDDKSEMAKRAFDFTTELHSERDWCASVP